MWSYFSKSLSGQRRGEGEIDARASKEAVGSVEQRIAEILVIAVTPGIGAALAACHALLDGERHKGADIDRRIEAVGLNAHRKPLGKQPALNIDIVRESNHQRRVVPV